VSTTTTERILDAAELLFARHGVDATSLRSITSEAGVNAAAIHYHFGSKEGLLEAVVSRRIAPLNQERLKQLDHLEATSRGGAIPLERLIEAFLGPVMAMARLGGRARGLGSVLASQRIEEAKAVRESVSEQMLAVKERFALAACRGREDDLSLDEAMERLDYCVASLGHTLWRSQRDGDPASPDVLAARLRRMIAFLAAGFAAPSARDAADAPGAADAGPPAARGGAR